MGAAGYGGYDGYGNDQPTQALHPADPVGAPTSMLPPVNPDDGGYDDRAGRRRQQKKSNTSTILLVVAGVLVLIGAILIGRTVFSDNGSDEAMAPRMVGYTVEEAQNLADTSGVLLKVGEKKECEKQPEGKICSQDPVADASMKKGETVTVVVSTGAPKVEVPDVLEKSEASARKILEDGGFAVEVETVESEATPGTVTKQDPEPGAKADRESEVKLTVAKKAAADMPDVRTRQYDAAVAQLNGLGFMNVSKQEVDSPEPAGIVVEQTPAGPSKQPEDVQIVLKVSKGPPEPEQVAVPELRNHTLGEVKAALAQAGLQLGNVEGPNDDNARVYRTDPETNQMVDKNGAVSVWTMPGGNNTIFGGRSG